MKASTRQDAWENVTPESRVCEHQASSLVPRSHCFLFFLFPFRQHRKLSQIASQLPNPAKLKLQNQPNTQFSKFKHTQTQFQTHSNNSNHSRPIYTHPPPNIKMDFYKTSITSLSASTRLPPSAFRPRHPDGQLDSWPSEALSSAQPHTDQLTSHAQDLPPLFTRSGNIPRCTPDGIYLTSPNIRSREPKTVQQTQKPGILANKKIEPFSAFCFSSVDVQPTHTNFPITLERLGVRAPKKTVRIARNHLGPIATIRPKQAGPSTFNRLSDQFSTLSIASPLSTAATTYSVPGTQRDDFDYPADSSPPPKPLTEFDQIRIESKEALRLRNQTRKIQDAEKKARLRREHEIAAREATVLQADTYSWKTDFLAAGILVVGYWAVRWCMS